MLRPPIRILLVEDSPVALILLKRLLGSCPEIELVGTARTGKEGLEMIPLVQPDVICTDLHMPEMDGLEFTQEVMANFPRPILVISSSVQAEDTQNVFNLLQAGAVDVFAKPRAGVLSNFEGIKQELISKIKILSGVAVFTLRRRPAGKQRPYNFASDKGAGRLSGREDRPATTGGSGFIKPTGGVSPPDIVGPRASPRLYNGRGNPSPTSGLPPLGGGKPAALHGRGEARGFTGSPFKGESRFIKVVAIGASTGGPQALHAILSHLSASLQVPVICVQHISEGFLQGLVDWLGSECQLPVTIATAGELPKQGTVYFPPEGKHLELDARGRFMYSCAPPLSGHRPSVTVTFNSVASFYGRGALGVLLTGMGRDGADGMQAIARAGGITIAQDEKSCVVFGMPKEAIALGAAQYILPISHIAPMLLNKLFACKI